MINLKYVFLLLAVILNLINTFINNDFLFSISLGLCLGSVIYDELTMFDERDK